MSLSFLLKVSRPGLWFQTVWLYVLPAAGIHMLDQPLWWLGLIYVTWPLNLLVYGWNDIVDADVDAANPRKDSWLFGARGTAEQLRRLPPWIIAFQVPFFVLFAVYVGVEMIPLLVALIALNALYNARIGGLRGRPPFDLINPLGYILVTVMGAWINALPLPSNMAFVYLVLFCLHAQVMGEIMDIEPDRESGRVTSATLMGAVPAKCLVIALVAAEGLILGLHFGDWVLGGFLLVAVPGLLLDLKLYGAGQYTRRQFTLLGVGMNVAGLASMFWVWFNGSIS